MLSRRGILGGLICAPAIVRASSLMPIKALFETTPMVVRGQNTLLTIDQITREAMILWNNSNAFIGNLQTQYDRDFLQSPTIGTKLRIRLPNYPALAGS